MVFSGATNIYIGNSAHTAAYMGNIMVWPGKGYGPMTPYYIEYTTPDGEPVDIRTTSGWTNGDVVYPGFDSNLVGNIYANGVGRYYFDSAVTYIGSSAWESGTTMYNGALTSVKFPASTSVIGMNAFRRQTQLTNIDFSDCTGLTGVDSYAFSGTGISCLVLPDSVQWVGHSIIDSCPNLTSITFGTGFTEIREGRFFIDDVSNITDIYCYATTAPTIPENTPFSGWSNPTAGSGTIWGGTLHYPAGSDYSNWLRDDAIGYLGYYGWTGVADL